MRKLPARVPKVPDAAARTISEAQARRTEAASDPRAGVEHAPGGTQSRDGYYPSGAGAVILLILLVVLLSGRRGRL
jgi:hypothetical protein